ncbi:hypothetical protein [Roseovarius aestuariivivens]|uniref:hypothetical protein n=1 Tax=Roseovarius aestuariivivens TaxID=1888910 RepID=UPI001436ADAA|nr:hypothetical protein [Roseovarius aestuariivivens]
MKMPPEMTEPGRRTRPCPHAAFLREDLLSRAFGGFDMDILLDRLFDTLSERRP